MADTEAPQVDVSAENKQTNNIEQSATREESTTTMSAEESAEHEQKQSDAPADAAATATTSTVANGDRTEKPAEDKNNTNVKETPSNNGSNPEEGATESLPKESSSSLQQDQGPDDEENENENETETETSSTKPSESTSTATGATTPIVSSSKKSRPPYKYNPDKITLRFLFAGRDGLTVTVECNPSDTVGEVKGALLSVWPKDLPNCAGGDQLRLICMGKGILMPDTRTLEDCQVPVFKTHPTPINVSVKPETSGVESSKGGSDGKGGRGAAAASSGGDGGATSQGCACVIL